MGGKGLDDRGQSGRTALHWAVERAQAEIVRILLVAGADPTAADDEHMTPLTRREEGACQLRGGLQGESARVLSLNRGMLNGHLN
jgi:hypothetical protein